MFSAVDPSYLQDKLAKKKLPRNTKVSGQIIGISAVIGHYLYLTLRGGGNGLIKVRVPATTKVLPFQFITIRGRVIVEKNKQSDSDIIVESTKIIKLQDPPTINIRRGDKIPFARYIETHDIRQLLVVSSKKALDVYKKPLEEIDIPISWFESEMSFTTDPTSFLKELDKELHRTQPNAIFFTRTGKKDSLSYMWDDPQFVQKILDYQLPVYSAIGGEDTQHLFDEFSDESFKTPDYIGLLLKGVIDEEVKKSKAHELNLEGLSNQEATVVLLKAIYKKLQGETEEENASESNQSNGIFDDRPKTKKIRRNIPPIPSSRWQKPFQFLQNFAFTLFTSCLMMFVLWFWFVL